MITGPPRQTANRGIVLIRLVDNQHYAWCPPIKTHHCPPVGTPESVTSGNFPSYCTKNATLWCWCHNSPGYLLFTNLKAVVYTSSFLRQTSKHVQIWYKSTSLNIGLIPPSVAILEGRNGPLTAVPLSILSKYR